jgi:hypothetical protein
MTVGEWTKFHIDVDIDRLHYSASMSETKLCNAVPLGAPKKRFVELPGVNIPMEMPVFKEFKSVLFVPGGKPGNVTFVDDVTVHWVPATVFGEPGKNVEFSDDFESYTPMEAIDSPALKPKWQQATPSKSMIIRDTSFGPGFKSLCVQGGGKITPRTAAALKTGTRLTLDLDFFLRSGEALPSIMPNTATKFPHSTCVGWADPEGKMIAGVKTENGTWHLTNGDGAWIDTQRRVHYDVWNHLQLVFAEDGTLQAATQPVGQVAAAIGATRVSDAGKDLTITPIIEPSATPGHLSCYDNVVITSGPPVK